MNYDELIALFKNRPFFETQDLNILFNEPPPQIEARLSRWVSQKKLIQLRRGKYLLPEDYRGQEPSDGYLSNYLYRPSYVSLHSALELYGLIPESVMIIEAVTTRQTALWSTPLGTFTYTSIKKDRFWGYCWHKDDRYSRNNQANFLIATPEKALLDFFYFQRGDWTRDRVKEMRFQNLETVNPNTLQEFSERFSSPKVSKAVKTFIKIYSDER